MSLCLDNFFCSGGFFSGERLKKTKKMAVQMTTDTVKNPKMTTELVVNFVFFEMLTTDKSANDCMLI